MVGVGASVPGPWTGAPARRVTPDVLADGDALDDLVDDLHRGWVERRPVVVEWAVGDDAVSRVERCDHPPWKLSPRFSFPLERLRFLCFTNNYDARTGDLVWWWAVKARRIGARPQGPGDVVLADGTSAWIDGGPRGPLDPLDLPVLHGEAIELGSSLPVPPPGSPEAGLAPDQTAAVAHASGPARIIAPAGSGKTRTLTARMRHLRDVHRIDPEHLLALAYNERAAAELRERLRADRSTARTIHSLGWQILREARPGLGLIEEAEARRVVDRLVSTPKRANTDPIAPYLEALQAVRSGLRDPAVVEAERDDVPGFAASFAPYRAALYAAGAVDHGEQVYGAIEALLADPVLRAGWQARCRHLLVDEFQDLTPAYVVLIRLVASPQLDVFGVGDDDQVIYGYDGADPGFLIDFDSLFPGAASHALEVNYRCPPDIVSAAGKLLAYNKRRIAKTIRPARDDEAPDALTIHTGPGDELAAEAADIVERWIGGGAVPGDIAVLARVNSSLIPVKAALVERQIATNDLVTAQSLHRTVLRALFAWMRIGMRPDSIDRSDALEAIVRPGRKLNRIARELIRRRSLSSEELRAVGAGLAGVQADRWDGLCDDVDAVTAMATGGDAAKLIRFLVRDIGLGAAARDLDSGRGNAARSAHHDDLVAIERAAVLHRRLGDFAAWLSRSLDRPSSPRGVTLSSVHRVKGMEWDDVVVFGVDRGSMPHDLAADLEEERRVFHVALTRARRRVVVMADRARPSRFLDELAADAPVAHGAPGPQDDAGGRIDEASRRQPEIEPVGREIDGKTAALVCSLKEWRLETSRRLGVPAFVVLHDRTIAEIAARKPSTERQLLAVPGIGTGKLESYGDDILAVVEAAAR